jgi:hypothetical protein
MVLQVDGRKVDPENITRLLTGDDTDGSLCQIRVAKPSNGAQVDVFVRRARSDVVEARVFSPIAYLVPIRHL